MIVALFCAAIKIDSIHLFNNHVDQQVSLVFDNSQSWRKRRQRESIRHFLPNEFRDSQFIIYFILLLPTFVTFILSTR